MRTRRPTVQRENNEVALTNNEDASQSRLRQFLCLLWDVVLWLSALAPGAVIIIWSVNCIFNERLFFWKMIKRVAYGQEAVGWGWIGIAVGLWAIGQGLEWKTGRQSLKLALNVLALVAICLGGWFLVESFCERIGIK